MAVVTQRTWKVPGQRAKRLAWGFTITVNGKRRKSYRSEWTREDAEKALARVQLRIETPKPAGDGITFAQAVERYLATKARKKSIAFDKLYLVQLTSAFGAETSLAQITASKISAWKSERLSAVSPRTKLPYAPASINRPLAALRHLLQLAYDEWEVLATVPKIRLEDEPEGRIRWLESDEEVRLLAACRKSKNKELLAVVTVAMETGLRRGELLGLTWERIDMTRGVIRLELTKSGRRREVPMRQTVYDLLAQLPGAREGRVFKTRSVRTAFENAVAEAGIENLHFHDLRHHFASQFVMRGGSLQALKELLGHADLKMTLRYAHLAPRYLRDEIEKTERRAQARAQEAPADVFSGEMLSNSL